MKKSHRVIILFPLTSTFSLTITLLLILANLGTAHAQTYQGQQYEQPGNISWSIVGGITNGGDTLALGGTTLTYNRDGEQIKAVDYSEKLKTGGFAVLGIGANYKIDERFSVQFNGSYHWDRISDPDLKFTRLELALIPYYQLNDNLQLGLGIVSHFNLKLGEQSTALFVKPARSDEDTELRVFNEFPDILEPYAQDLIDGQLRTDDYVQIKSKTDFSNATGYLASIVYQLPQWHSKVELRAVFIDYKANITTNILSSQQILDTVNSDVKLDAKYAGIYWHWFF
jgi:hypothetical protein